LTLVTGDSISLKKDGRPDSPSKGLVALNSGGVWKPVCTEKWDDVRASSVFSISLKKYVQEFALMWLFKNT